MEANDMRSMLNNANSEVERAQSILASADTALTSALELTRIVATGTVDHLGVPQLIAAIEKLREADASMKLHRQATDRFLGAI